MKVKVYDGKTIVEGADLALKNRLYVSGWALSDELKWARHEGMRLDQWTSVNPDYHQRYKIALAFKDNVPVAVVLWTGHTMMAFCRAAERRNGYASACVKALNIQTARAWPGVERASIPFWKKNGIRLYTELR